MDTTTIEQKLEPKREIVDSSAGTGTLCDVLGLDEAMAYFDAVRACRIANYQRSLRRRGGEGKAGLF